ncbi:MAG TPA: dihydrodipicolinate synthase family protein [Candidatus Paceibacterota bacterium]|nr:dihydrodipicolinate synthase family protein [Verrucomicrobiota bacterium]HOX01509.1 dihydrodipicolinate synthase family protein [Verrucomicrobiota bacterium]HRZ44247.1 dihydrodipicolinate synthase family protein [Candidatus Paceibacterota bacterium]HRZ91881.1 dihydrodipicolinate synthase family protein [Candidatus Paceibacterota bacterium]
MMKRLPQPLAGVVPPMLTPLEDRDALDCAGLERLIDHLLAGGVHGLFVLGTTGEGPNHSYRLRRELVARTCQIVQGRVPVLVGITDTSFVESIHLARQSAESGADGLVLAPPFYHPPGPPELRAYLEHLLPELPLPLFLYNLPSLTKVSITLDTIRWAMDQPGIAGIKDSSASMIYFHQVRALLPRRPGWTLLIGPEELLGEAVLLGGHGGICGGANMFPRLYVNLFKAAHAGDIPRTRALQDIVGQVADRIYGVGAHASAVIKGIKTAAACLGICGARMAEPFPPFHEAEQRRIEQAVRDLQPLISL